MKVEGLEAGEGEEQKVLEDQEAKVEEQQGEKEEQQGEK